MAVAVFHPLSSHACCLLLHHSHNHNHKVQLLHCRHTPSHSVLSITLPSFLFHLRPCRATPLDSNSTQNFDMNGEDEEEGDADDDDDDEEQWDVLEEYIDSIWIFKVFNSYGLMLPAIVISMLLASGPKAFLLALALPLGQSTFAFAFQKMQEDGKKKPRLKTNKMKKGRSRARNSRNVELEHEQAKSVGNQEAKRKKKGYQSWVSKTDVSTSSDDRSSANFGGWDELDEVMMRSNFQSSRRRPAPKSSRLQESPAKKKVKLRSRWSERDLPLLLRLLISSFPFLDFLD